MKIFTNNSTITILVIDDSKEIQQLIKMSLEMINQWQVISANSGLQGLKIAIEKDDLDLILLDYLMPQNKGDEIIKKLQANPKTASIPVIFLTAQSDEQFHWKKLGAKGIIYKPFNPINLGDLIRDILECRM
ncbi:two-component response regulator [Geminocystis sp. NIES-3709]|nr:two-component response regulator [Geminocystis sp. NIES-3709]